METMKDVAAEAVIEMVAIIEESMEIAINVLPCSSNFAFSLSE